MRLEELIEVVKDLEVGSSRELYKSTDGCVFYVKRPKGEVKKLKREYKVESNVQIWAKEPNKEDFMPNHLRILMDLDLKRLTRPELKKRLLLLFDRLFYGEDPERLYTEAKDIPFPEPLRPLDYDMYLEQLFMTEQVVGYIHESRFEPKYLYLHGWVRCSLCGDMEIDKLCWSATRGPPPVRFTKQDNKKHREYNPKREELWYLHKN